MASPAQMFEHGLDPIKGWFHMHALDKSAQPADSTDVRLVAGRVVYLDADAKFEVGLGASAVGIFLWQGRGSYDVLRDDGGVGGGVHSGLVCTGGYELESTEFVDAAYAPNDPLTAENSDASDDKGKLKGGTIGTDTLCGIVSDGKLTNENGIDVLRFWTYFLPVLP